MAAKRARRAKQVEREAVREVHGEGRAADPARPDERDRSWGARQEDDEAGEAVRIIPAAS